MNISLNLLIGTLELRLDAEAPDRSKCSAVPGGGLLSGKWKKVQDRLADVLCWA